MSIILKWREYRYVYVADAEKMFRQILINPKDLDYQRILWRDSKGELQAYQLLTVTYGTACAPYLANRVIKQLAQDEGDRFPLAKPILKENIYVDAVPFGADDIPTAIETKVQLSPLMESGGFHLRKWVVNDEELLKGCATGKHELALEFQSNEDNSLKVFGLSWNPKIDSFQIGVNLETIEFPTKRTVLSLIAKLYDPLGWITPVIVTAKLFMQELWLRKIDWDETLPLDLKKQWFNFYPDLISLKDIVIPRWIGLYKSNTTCEFHGYADASNRAYAACIYMRLINQSGMIQISLIIAKSKVAPVTPVSIPRLELCACVLLAKLFKFVLENMSSSNVPCFCYTDSNVALAWLAKHPSTWKTFVANRVVLINELIPKAKWLHVATKDNPADCASRGLLPNEIGNFSLWWKGPSSLSSPYIDVLKRGSKELVTTNLELKTVKSTCLQSTHKNDHFLSLISQFPSWPKLLRVITYCFRFITNCKGSKITNKSDSLCLSNVEIDQVRLRLVRLLQREYFEKEINSLNKNKTIFDRSSIKNLNPFLDKTEVLRVGGRLRHAPIGYDERHPIILPKHKFSEMIIYHAHIRCLHGGTQLTMHTLRQSYWIIGARSLVKTIIKKCVICVREKAAITQQLMGDLPEFRVTPSRPFAHTVVDYAGPFDVKTSSGRGYKSHKAYIALFVCCCVRAVHLELVSYLTSIAFLAAFQRFVSRRGKPSHMYSDNGKNFVGAAKELKRHLKELRCDNDLRNLLAVEGTSWHFVPPNAPHFGGLWEAGVKSVKIHLRRIVGLHKFTFEEFSTLLTRIEATLNSRPIAPLSESVDDFSYLTPGHFLTGTPITSIPEPSLEFTPENRLNRWETIQRIAEIFWKKWAIDYLHTLQKRYKWSSLKPNVSIGDLVLLRQDDLPPAHWLLGRIIECHTGPDNLIRVVKVKTAHSEFVRPISKLCLLPVKSGTNDEIV
ncbi:uncharacterized protein LOC127278227 [Leptopilina boulardi]|uniref:uncharacterized protein LOC127278227 n=1 Tax=Leptopilina boulardi TaxID=63433 RepID=UPI0021F65D8A|nr:uncharacterized protein LOC127278227 [Leptopilina boulardi]